MRVEHRIAIVYARGAWEDHGVCFASLPLCGVLLHIIMVSPRSPESVFYHPVQPVHGHEENSQGK